MNGPYHEPQVPPSGTPMGWIWLAVTVLVVAATGAVLILLTQDLDAPTAATESTTVTTTESTIAAPGATITLDGADDDTMAAEILGQWLDTYQWTEVARNPELGDRTVVHRLELTNVSGETAVGRFRQGGFDPTPDVAVVAELIDGVINIMATPVVGDTSPYLDREVIIRLGGEPTTPTTQLAGIVTLLPDLEEVAPYFAPGPGGTTVVEGVAVGDTTTTASSSTTSTTSASSSTTAPSTTEANPAAAWLGTYRWTEFVGDGSSADRSVIHQLVLTDVDGDGSLAGQLTQNGQNVATNVTVAAVIDGNGIAVRVVADLTTPPVYSVDTVLFRLDGEPSTPLTTRIGLAVLQPDRIATGTYFVRG